MGMERLEGESEASYVARQRSLQDSAQVGGVFYILCCYELYKERK